MQVNLLSIKNFKKAALTSVLMLLLIFMFLMAMIPFSAANEDAPTMQAMGPGKIPTIDGKWSAGEWDDALEYIATNSTFRSYVRVKWNGSYLYILIDSPWDTTNSAVYPYENTWIAFDTTHSHGSTPQIGDYLFSVSAMVAYWGNGTRWNTMLSPSGFKAQSSSSDEWGPGVQPSPKNSTPHRIDEFRVPLTYVGQTNQTVGFYFLVIDDTASAQAYVEWPVGSGGNPLGWPVGSSYTDPCPPPSAWGHLTFLHRPTAAFTWDPQDPDVVDVVTFDATTSHDFDGTIANYTWNWGDLSSNVTANPITAHIFSTAGSYDVNLTVTDNDGLSSSVVHTVKVGVVAAYTFSPPAPNPGDVVSFNATASYAPGGTVANYTWDFDDGNVTVVSDTVIDHIFSTGGRYTVNLTVTDNFTRQAWVVHTVNVGIPVGNFTFLPSKPNARDAIVFDATASSDPDGIANYTWNWGDLSSNVTANPITAHIFSTAGSYDVNLTVTDNTNLKNSVFDTVNVYAPREAHFSFWPSTPNVSDAVAFNASLSKDPGGAIANYTWNFDDGNITTVNAPDDTIIHIFSTAGSYNVNLTVTDNDGLKSWYAHTVNVGIPAFQATVPFSTTIPIIDGNWTGTEWDDAPEYNITGSGGTGYIRVKHNDSHLFVIIDSVWDSTLKSDYGSFEGTYVAFDTEHDKSTVGPQLDDYLFFCGYSAWINAWVGNGTQWTRIYDTGYNGTQGLGTSPNSATPHRIDEMAVPMAYAGSIGSTSGFYVIVRDDSSWVNTTYTAWVEWPSGAGGDSRGWPVPPDYIDPCPTLDKWGYLIIEPPMKTTSNITLDISSPSITLGESVTISGTVSNRTGAIAGVDVTIQYKTGTTGWTKITAVTADSTGSYTYDWTPSRDGTFEVRTSWAGDAGTYGAESEIKTLEVTRARLEPVQIIVIGASLAVVVVIVATAVYLLKVRKPKRQSYPES